MIYLSYAVAWISTAAGVIAGVYFTRSPWCLWAFLLPWTIHYESRTSNKRKSGEDSSECGKTRE